MCLKDLLMTAIVGESMDRKISWEPNIQGTITDGVLIVTFKTVGRQSKFRDLMKMQLYLRLHTEEFIHATLQEPTIQLLQQHLLRANLRVNTGDSENKHTISSFSFPSTLTYFEDENQYFPISTHVDENLLGTYSPSFISPATSESNYFSVSVCNMNNLGGAQNLQHSESDLTDLISATNSPIGGLDFSIVDPAELDPNFNFTGSGFFT